MEFALNFERGAPAQQIMKLQRFNYDKGFIEPINISDQNFELRVYEKEKFIAETRLQGPEDYIPFEIIVSEEEVNELKSVRTKEEFQVRFFEKAIAQGITEAIVHNNDGTQKLGKDGKPLKVRIGLKEK